MAEQTQSLRGELQNLHWRSPFEPFRIKLVNGDFHDVGEPLGMALLSWGVFVASQEGHWAVFAYDKIAAIESLLSFNAMPDAEAD